MELGSLLTVFRYLQGPSAGGVPCICVCMCVCMYVCTYIEEQLEGELEARLVDRGAFGLHEVNGLLEDLLVAHVGLHQGPEAGHHCLGLLIELQQTEGDFLTHSECTQNPLAPGMSSERKTFQQQQD